MRSLFAAVVVLGLSVALLSRSVLAEAPLPTERREASAILAALKKKPAQNKAPLAVLRFYVEVAGGNSLQVSALEAPSTAKRPHVSANADQAQNALDSAWFLRRRRGLASDGNVFSDDGHRLLSRRRACG
jgi:hypothetical protein